MSTNVLVVGCGSIGVRHLQVLRERRDVTLAACDADAAGRARALESSPGLTVFDALEAALAWGPQIVVVAVPNALHRHVAERSFAAGAHVFCEKPIADTVADGQAMVAAAARAGRVLAVGYSERFRESLEYVHQQVAAGALGSLVGGRAMVGTYQTLLCAKTDYRAEVFGALLVDYTHEFDFLRWLFGEVVEVVAMGHALGDRPKRCRPMLAATLLRFASGAIVSVHMDYIQHPQRRTLEVFGDLKSLVLDLETDVLTAFDSAGAETQTLRFNADRNTRFRKEHQDMLDAVLRGTPPRVSGADAVKVLEIAEAAIRQCAQPRPIVANEEDRLARAGRCTTDFNSGLGPLGGEFQGVGEQMDEHHSRPSVSPSALPPQ